MLNMLLAVAAASQIACPVLDARYSLRETPSVTAWFQPRQPTAELPSPVSLMVHSDQTGATYTFVPTAFGNVVGVRDRLVLAPTRDQPQSAVDRLEPIFKRTDFYFVARGDYSFYASFAPDRTTEAPAHILIPGLPELMWYGDFNNRQAVPRAFFDLASCRARPR
jgi:hypothetical protein